MRIQLLVMAKVPLPGRVKTRLCPPCSPEQAAAVAAAALTDTLDAVSATPAVRRILVIDGQWSAPAGWAIATQRGDRLGQRLAHAYGDTALPGIATVLVGMDTPQLNCGHLAAVAAALDDSDAVLGPAADGGWWVLGLRDPEHGAALASVPMSSAHTGLYTTAALRARGLTVRLVSTLTDVDTAADARTVAAACPDSRFAAAVFAHIPW
jgi:rSAM/selenodomain-associated transferase 1